MTTITRRSKAQEFQNHPNAARKPDRAEASHGSSSRKTTRRSGAREGRVEGAGEVREGG